jgi:tetratricopeptide (TPR) repeat protein
MRAPFKAAALAALLASALVAQGAQGQESELDALRAAAKASPADPGAAFALGHALLRAGHPVEALAELRRGVNLPGGRAGDLGVKLHWEIARAHVAQRDFGQTVVACRVLGALPGAATPGHACMAEAHILWKRSAEAEPEIRAALANGTRSYEAKVAEAGVHELELKDGEAEASYREAIVWQPDQPVAHELLGKLLVRDGKAGEGVSELRRAVALDPTGPDAAFDLAAALGPTVEARALLERATRDRPGFALAWQKLAATDLALGQTAPARQAAEAALRIDAQDADSHLVLGKVALADGRYDDAIRAGDSALRLVANSAQAKLLIADANAKKGEIDLALEAYQAAWGFDHGDPAPLVHASEACHAAGRDTSARAYAVRATQEFPSWGPAWAALGDAAAGQKETADARSAYEKALKGDGPVDKAAVARKLDALR